jgi:hypothetical protein
VRGKPLSNARKRLAFAKTGSGEKLGERKEVFSRRRLAKEFDQEVMQETERALNVMKSIPHVLPFERRVLLFRYVKTTVCFATLLIRTKVLPRQAPDKRRENSKTDRFLAGNGWRRTVHVLALCAHGSRSDAPTSSRTRWPS